jgi:hypothetical protein
VPLTKKMSKRIPCLIALLIVHVECTNADGSSFEEADCRIGGSFAPQVYGTGKKGLYFVITRLSEPRSRPTTSQKM